MNTLITTYNKICHSYSMAPDKFVLEQLINQNDAQADNILITLQGYKLQRSAFVPIAKSLASIQSAITSINISYNPLIKDEGFKYLYRSIMSAQSLVKLSCSNIGISDSTSQLICSIIETQPLHELNISNNCFNSITYERISSSFENHSILLESLDISNNLINENSVSLLIESIVKFTNLRVLNLSRCKLKYKCGYNILCILNRVNAKALKLIDLSYNSISESIMKEITNRLGQKPKSTKERPNIFSSTHLRKSSYSFCSKSASKLNEDQKQRGSSILSHRKNILSADKSFDSASYSKIYAKSPKKCTQQGKLYNKRSLSIADANSKINKSYDGVIKLSEYINSVRGTKGSIPMHLNADYREQPERIITKGIIIQSAQNVSSPPQEFPENESHDQNVSSNSPNKNEDMKGNIIKQINSLLQLYQSLDPADNSTKKPSSIAIAQDIINKSFTKEKGK